MMRDADLTLPRHRFSLLRRVGLPWRLRGRQRRVNCDLPGLGRRNHDGVGCVYDSLGRRFDGLHCGIACSERGGRGSACCNAIDS